MSHFTEKGQTEPAPPIVAADHGYTEAFSEQGQYDGYAHYNAAPTSFEQTYSTEQQAYPCLLYTSDAADE